MTRPPLLAEDLLLLAIDPHTGKQRSFGWNPAGTTMFDLALLGLLEISPEPSRMFRRETRLRACGQPPSDPLLAEVWAVAAERDRTWTGLIRHITKTLRVTWQASERLVQRDAVRREEERVLGVRQVRWPTVDPTVRSALLAEVTGVFEGIPSSRHAVALAMITLRAQAVPKVLGLGTRGLDLSDAIYAQPEMWNDDHGSVLDICLHACTWSESNGV